MTKRKAGKEPPMGGESSKVAKKTHPAPSHSHPHPVLPHARQGPPPVGQHPAPSSSSSAPQPSHGPSVRAPQLPRRPAGSSTHAAPSSNGASSSGLAPRPNGTASQRAVLRMLAKTLKLQQEAASWTLGTNFHQAPQHQEDQGQPYAFTFRYHNPYQTAQNGLNQFSRPPHLQHPPDHPAYDRLGSKPSNPASGHHHRAPPTFNGLHHPVPGSQHTVTAQSWQYSITSQPPQAQKNGMGSSEDDRVRQLELLVQTQAATIAALQAQVSSFDNLWQKMAPTYPLQNALTDSHTLKGIEIRGKTNPPPTFKDPELSRCPDKKCDCPTRRLERAMRQPRPKRGWRTPRPCGFCHCCQQHYFEHCQHNFPQLSFPQLKDFGPTESSQKLKDKAATLHTSGTAIQDSYESLENIGDAVLELVARLLVHDYDTWSWSRRHQLKTYLVKNKSLSILSAHFQLPDRLITGLTGPADEGVREKMKVQADMLEAHIGGLFEDIGWEATRDWVRSVLEPILLWLQRQMSKELLF